MTKININIKTAKNKFVDVMVGDWFEWNDFIYIKTSVVSNGEYNSYNLSRKERQAFESGDTVQPIALVDINCSAGM